MTCWNLTHVLDTEVLAGSGGEPGGGGAAYVYSCSEHTLPITALVCGSGGAGALLVSASLDRTTKLW